MPDNFLVHVTHVLGEINLDLFHATDERISLRILYLLEIILRKKKNIWCQTKDTIRELNNCLLLFPHLLLPGACRSVFVEKQS